jgi:CelD/BcsL family acetyltransferase involved in cellulose biosynthesis
LDYQVIESVDGFRALATHWQRLAATGGVRTPYQSFPWLDQWLRYRGRDVEPFIVVLQKGETLAPFGNSNKGGFRVLSMLGAPDSDYVDLVTTRSLDEAWDGVARALADRRRSFDVVHLQSVPEREPIISALRRHINSAGRERTYERCPWIDTRLSWDELRKSRGSGLRNELKRWDRRVRELGELKIECVRPPLDGGLLGELESVERESWKWEQGNAAFRPGAQRQFLEALLQDPRAGVVVWLMRLSSRLIGFALVLIGTDRWYYYLPSFRKDVPNAGSLLLAQIVEAACVSGCTVVDLLRGDHGYKRKWSDRANTVYEIVWPANFRGRMAALAFAVRWKAAGNSHLQRLRDRLLHVGDRRS